LEKPTELYVTHLVFYVKNYKKGFLNDVHETL